jgi:hypothetical protein
VLAMTHSRRFSLPPAYLRSRRRFGSR